MAGRAPLPVPLAGTGPGSCQDFPHSFRPACPGGEILSCGWLRWQLSPWRRQPARWRSHWGGRSPLPAGGMLRMTPLADRCPGKASFRLPREDGQRTGPAACLPGAQPDWEKLLARVWAKGGAKQKPGGWQSLPAGWPRTLLQLPPAVAGGRRAGWQPEASRRKPREGRQPKSRRRRGQRSAGFAGSIGTCNAWQHLYSTAIAGGLAGCAATALPARPRNAPPPSFRLGTAEPASLPVMTGG